MRKHDVTLGILLCIAPSMAFGASEKHGHGNGPHGGVVFDLGAHHAEFTVDHGKKEATVHFLGGDLKSLIPVEAEELSLTTKETKTADGTIVPSATVTLRAKDRGKSATFSGTDPVIGNVADFSGTVLGEIDGKPSQGEFEE
jgi:hypothetical protein